MKHFGAGAVQMAMRAIIASLGTDGDILPFLGMAVGLRGRGHRVTFLAAGNYRELVGAHGIEFRELVSAEKMRELLAHADFWHPIKVARFTGQWGGSLIEPQYRLIDALAAEDRESVLVTNPAILAAKTAHEARGTPLCHVILQPWMIHSPKAPALMPLGLPRWAPRFMHSLFYHAIDLAAAALIGPAWNRLRRSLGLKPVGRLFKHWFSEQRVIGMFPEWFGPPQRDWPAQVRLVGFPRFDGAMDRSPPAGLPEFLNSARPTVVFTFGSGMMLARNLFGIAARVCETLDCQGLFISRHFRPEPLPARIFHAEWIPFRDIFPRCAGVVHHGGIGTTAEALAAGTPQLIVPLGFDQLDNGDRAQALGAGMHTKSKHRLLIESGAPRARDVAEITDGLRRVLGNEFRTRAKAVAERFELGEQKPIERAVEMIEEVGREKREMRVVG